MTPGNADWGRAHKVNVSYKSHVEFARIWAGFYLICEGGGGPTVLGPSGKSGYVCSNTGALTGVNSNLMRWTEAIGGSAAHEAGHTYGLAHKDDNPPTDPCVKKPEDWGYPLIPGEDAWYRHLMPTGCNLTGLHRTTYRRHFSIRDYGILATNVGLAIETMHNWDLINPNAESATSLAIDFLSPLSTVNIAWSYAGSRSPWINPVVSGPTGVAVFKGKTYNKFRITWSIGNPTWKTPGVVAGGAVFHIGTAFTGADFNQPDPIIIQSVTLLDSSFQPLALNPSLPSYDTGTADKANNQFVLQFLAPASAPELRMSGATVIQLPQLATIDAMGEGLRPLARGGRPIRPWSSTECSEGRLQDNVSCVVAKLDQEPHIIESYTTDQLGVINCGQGALPDLSQGDDQSGKAREGFVRDDVRTCAGTQQDPFPSAVVYVVATFVDPNTRHYDPVIGAYVTGPVTSKLYYQFAGIRRREFQ
jgi:hypothetical protein